MNHPDLDTLLKSLGTGGWDDLEGLDAKAEAQAKAAQATALEKARIFEAAFNTRAGKEVLEWLLSVTIYRPGWLGETMEEQSKLASYGLFRDGQNSIAWMILKALALARGEQPPIGNLGGD